MEYILNSSMQAMPFFVPSTVVDKHIKIATANQIKVLLCFLRNMTNGSDSAEIASFLSLPKEEVLDCLEFWAQAGVLTAVGKPETKQTEEKPQKKTIRSGVVKPSREDIATVAARDNKLTFLFGEAELKLARPLRGNELQTLAWLYLDHGMDVSLILMLVEYSISEGKPTISFIESTALSWLDCGVETISDAEEQIEARAKRKTAWGMVMAAFGIEYRQPSDKELDLSHKWAVEWGFSREMLRNAYNICVDKNAKLSMPYINKILEKWRKDGVKTPADIEKSAKPKQKENGYAKYDRSLVDKLLNNDD